MKREATGIAIGVLMGVAIGAFFDKIAIGIILGVAMGIAVGPMLKDRKWIHRILHHCDLDRSNWTTRLTAMIGKRPARQSEPPDGP